jgi:hypothetical protein
MKHDCDLSETAAKLLIDEINCFSQKTRSKSFLFNGFCPFCRTNSRIDNFRQHAYRTRQFYIISDRIIYVIPGNLPRWKCPVCHRTFTEYPIIIVPHRRYTKFQINKLLHRKDAVGISYRASVLHTGMPIFHSTESIKSDEMPEISSILSHTSLYRWKLSTK